MTDEVERWAWWRAALKGEAPTPSEGYPEQGYYRVRRKGGQWEPVAIWQGGDKWYAKRGQNMVADVNSLWTWALRHPVDYRAYQRAMAGEGWEDEPVAGMGHNRTGDPYVDLLNDMADNRDLAAEYLAKGVETQADADRVAILAKRIAEISKAAEAERVREKKPHLEAAEQVDARWHPLVEGATDLATALKDHVSAFLIAAKRAATAVAAATGVEVKNARAGRTGATVAVRVERRARIVDYDACLSFFKERPEVRELVGKLAQRAVKAGVKTPGVEVEEVEKVQ
jgi:hypothetical protein